MTNSNTNFNQNSAKIYTGEAGGELYISTNTSKQTISATNNRSQYYAEQSKKYRDEAKLLRDDTKFYAEQNSDVTVEFVNNLKAELLREISTKQPSGDYALKSELPINVSELENDSAYVTNSEFPTLVEEFLPEQENNTGKFLMTNENELSWQSITGFSLFDITLKDHILSYEESKGWALQGTYVYKEAVAGSRYGYPDFYAKCLEEYTEATSTETVNDVEVKVHSNGHKFYNISDKTAIDDFFNSMGSAWFYGVDTENERIFLPRNNWFEQLTTDVSEVGKSIDAGLPNVTGTFQAYTKNIGYETGAFTYNDISLSGQAGQGNYDGVMSFDASRSSSIYGNSKTVQPKSVKKLLYICVGNAISQSTITEVVEVTTTDNDTTPLFTGMYFDFKPSNVSWLKAGEQANSGGIYTTCYNELVNELTNPKYGLKVINIADMIAGIDYSEYWKVDQDKMTFTTPDLAGLVRQLQAKGRILVDKKEPTTADPTWYNLYSDGWLEQGGKSYSSSTGASIISLPKSFRDTNYTVLTNGGIDGASNSNSQADYLCQPYGLTISSFTIQIHTALGHQYTLWEASGYAEIPTPADYSDNLYFKVANAVQNLELLDAGEVLEAVNDVVPNNSSLIAGYAMPSNKYVNLELGASGTVYTAPANGWFQLQMAYVADKYVDLWNSTAHVGCIMSAASSGYSLRASVPCKKGDVVAAYYTATNVDSFRFIYAQGEVK